MSQVDIERFYEIAQNSEELQNLLGDAEDRNSFVDTAVRLGAEHGCNFTIEEANAFLDTKKGDAELSDQELEAVAGGRPGKHPIRSILCNICTIRTIRVLPTKR